MGITSEPTVESSSNAGGAAVANRTGRVGAPCHREEVRTPRRLWPTFASTTCRSCEGEQISEYEGIEDYIPRADSHSLLFRHTTASSAADSWMEVNTQELVRPNDSSCGCLDGRLPKEMRLK